MPIDSSRSSVPVDDFPPGRVLPERKRSLSMLMALGMMLANGARADARESRERLRRKLDAARCAENEPPRR